MLPTKEIAQGTARRFEAYESGDLARILDIYTDDAIYWDTKAGSGIQGKAALTRHFTEFFGRFHTRFAVLEEHRLEGQDAAIVLWQCAVRRKLADGSLGEQIVMQRGMNLCALRGEQVCRDESYMDLASLEALFEASAT